MAQSLLPCRNPVKHDDIPTPQARTMPAARCRSPMHAAKQDGTGPLIRTTRALAQALAVSPSTAWRYCRDGAVPAVKAGTWIVLRDSLALYHIVLARRLAAMQRAADGRGAGTDLAEASTRQRCAAARVSTHPGEGGSVPPPVPRALRPARCKKTGGKGPFDDEPVEVLR